MPLPSVFQGVQDCRLPGLKPPKPFRRLFSGGSRLPFARAQTLQTLPQASKATTLTATGPCHLFLGGSRLPFARPQTLQTLPQASKATTLTATCPCHLFFRGFKAAVCPASNPPNPSAGLQGNNSYTCHLFFRGFKTAVCLASNSYIPLPSVFQGVQDCRLPGLKRSKPFRRPPRQQLLQLHAPAICFSGGSRLPFARPQTPQTLPQASKATTLTATCPCHLFFRGFKTAVCPASNPPNPSAGLQGNNSYTCHLFFRGFKTAVCPASNPPNPSAGLQGNNSYSYMPLPSVFQGVQDCRLPGLKPPKPSRRPFSGGSRLPAVCPASNPPNPSTGLQGNNSYSYMPLPSVFQGVQDCRLPGLKRSKPFRRPPRQQLLQLHAPAICFSGGSRLPFARPQTLQTLPQASKATTLTATCHLFFRGFKTAVCPASNPPNPPAGLFQGAQDCRLPGLKRSKPFRRPPRQQFLQLHAPAICFSGGSRLPFARPQTLQTLPQASKATTLTATCPCHPFFRGFKAAVCPASNPPNLSAGLQGNNSYTCHLFFRGFKTAVCPASNPPNPSAGLQGNNSYSYMPLPSVFQGAQDCRLPGLKPSKPFRRPPRQQLLHLPSVFQGVQDCRLPGLKPPKPFRRPPRQQLLQLHAPAICFSGGSRLPFARPQTLQTLPQASKATATCPCHLFLLFCFFCERKKGG